MNVLSQTNLNIVALLFSLSMVAVVMFAVTGATACADHGGCSNQHDANGNVRDEGGGDPPPVNGRCGTAAQRTDLVSAPNNGLCAAGTATFVQGTLENGWSWSCRGENGGSDASCSAVGLCTGGISTAQPNTLFGRLQVQGGGGRRHDLHPAPSVTVTASFVGDSWGESLDEAAPADQVAIQYSGTFANPGASRFSSLSCVSTGFDSGGQLSGTATFMPGEDMGLGESTQYRLSCTDSLCGISNSSSASVGITLPSIPVFEMDSQFVRAGNVATVSWEVQAAGREPFPMSCELFGPFAEEDKTFSIPQEAVGSRTTQPLINKTINTLMCTESVTSANNHPATITASSSIEVVPGLQEL